MPEFQLKAGGGIMTPAAACEYAASWGSVNACGLYGFDESFRPQSESHRQYCLEQMEGNRCYVETHPAEYEPDELDKLDSFVRALKAAPLLDDSTARPPAGADTFQTLDEFTRGYIEALFFTDSAPSMESDEWRETEARGDEIPEGSFPADMGVNDLAPEALARIVADCEAFQRDAAPLLSLAYARNYDSAQAGRDFHYTRNGHGVGFWDRRELETDSRAEYERLTAVMVSTHKSDPDAWAAALKTRDALKAESLGEQLSALARKAGGLDSYWGDDSLVYV